MQNPFDPGYFCSEDLRSFGFRAVGENVFISRAANIIGLHNIEIGDNVRIDAGTHIIANVGTLRLGSWIRIHTACFIGCRGGVAFGDFTGMSHGASIFTASDDFSGHWMLSHGIPEDLTNATVEPVTLGDHAIICANSTVLPGCPLATGSIVGAMSLLTKPTQPWGIYAGTPARRMKERERRILELEQMARVPLHEAA